MRGFRVCLVAVLGCFVDVLCLHVWRLWGVLGARVDVFGGLGGSDSRAVGFALMVFPRVIID